MARPLELYVYGLERYAWTGPILPSLQVKTLSFSLHLLLQRFPLSQFQPFLTPAICGVGPRRFESNIASHSRTAQNYCFRLVFWIRSPAMFPTKLTVSHLWESDRGSRHTQRTSLMCDAPLVKICSLELAATMDGITGDSAVI